MKSIDKVREWLKPVEILQPADERQLSPERMRQLHNVATQFRQNAGHVLLISGPGGSGKTLSAQVLARQMKADLYRVDLSALVGKYIGETEKNLLLLFETAEAMKIILYFDEADSLFGKRRGVRDTQDRYANLDAEYVLSRIGAHRGLLIFTTNMSQPLEPAFLQLVNWTVSLSVPLPKPRMNWWQRWVAWKR